MRPEEERGYGGWFFAVSLLLLAVTAWAVYDEAETRRPWKGYQREFFRLERAAVKQELAAAELKLATAPVKEELAKLEAELAAAKEPAKPESQKAAAEVERMRARVEELQQALGFTRSERDEAYYLWKRGLHQRAESGAEKKRYEDLARKVADQERALDRITPSLEQDQARLDADAAKLTQLARQRDALVADRDRLTRRLEALEQKRPAIEQATIPELAAVDRCMTCHQAIDRPGFDGPDWKDPFRSHPDRAVLLGKNHPVDRFGCVSCHRGQGPLLKGVGRAPFDHGRSDLFWETPRLEPPFTESSCAGCHPAEWELQAAPNLNRGKKLFADLACAACHLAAGFETARRIGPSLLAVKSKVSPEWLLAWLSDPKALRPITRMPNAWPPATDPRGRPLPAAAGAPARAGEIAAVAAYLFSVSTEAAPAAGATAGDALQGKKLFVDRGCIGCHRPAALGLPAAGSAENLEDFGPELNGLGGKTGAAWIETFLLNPAAWSKETRMPSSTLVAVDAGHLAAYLAAELEPAPFPAAPNLADPALAEPGRVFIAASGCFGCHELKGFETALKVGPELNGFGDKAVSFLSFGDTVTDFNQQTWRRWTELKLGSPRIFAAEREKLVMPNDGLDPSQVQALAVYLKSLRAFSVGARARARSDLEAEAESGRRLMREYNCRGCHLEDGAGGELRKAIADPGLVPPDLTGEGKKVQPAWLFQFLKQPSILRPWLTMRMPVFGFSDAQVQGLVSYFMLRAQEGRRFVEVPQAMAPTLLAETTDAFIKLKCLQCHQLTLGGQLKLSDLAPDMALTRSRLRPEWVAAFIIDPQRVLPGTKMPSFFPREDDEDPASMMTPLPAWLAGDPPAQIAAIKDYLYLMKSQDQVAVQDQSAPPPGGQ